MSNTEGVHKKLFYNIMTGYERLPIGKKKVLKEKLLSPAFIYLRHLKVN